MAAVAGLPGLAASSASAVDALVGESAGWVARLVGAVGAVATAAGGQGEQPGGEDRGERATACGTWPAQTSVSDMRDEPPSTWRWVWNTVWPAPAPVLAMSR